MRYDNQSITKRKTQKDIKKLVQINLIVSFSKSSDKDNEDFSFYKMNTNIWKK
ncbi:hypothetical protein [Borreliella andersonii]|uniref:hypothetical protein n=1 Tax=Borrelia andersonii TaxID=42109 RepID=UPI003AB4D3A4